MTLDKEAARELIRARAQMYYQTQREETLEHGHLKAAIKQAKADARLTQQEIADATDVAGNSLSRQRIGQILNED